MSTSFFGEGAFLLLCGGLRQRLISSHNPLACFRLQHVSLQSFRWHIERFGFADAQTGVSIVHYIFVCLFTHLPELTRDQEDDLNAFRHSVIALGQLTLQLLKEHTESDEFCEKLKGMVALMSDLQEWEPARNIIAAADEFMREGKRPVEGTDKVNSECPVGTFDLNGCVTPTSSSGLCSAGGS